VRSHVPLERARLTERLVTDGTLVQLLTGVCAQVGAQVRGQEELLATRLTRVMSLIQVGATEMSVKVTGRLEDLEKQTRERKRNR